MTEIHWIWKSMASQCYSEKEAKENSFVTCWGIKLMIYCEKWQLRERITGIIIFQGKWIPDETLCASLMLKGKKNFKTQSFFLASLFLKNFFLKFIYNWRIIALPTVLVSARHQHEWAIVIHMSSPFWTFPPTPPGCYRAFLQLLMQLIQPKIGNWF